MKYLVAAALFGFSCAKSSQTLRNVQSVSYDEDQAMQAHAYAEIVQCDSNRILFDWSCQYCENVISPMSRRLNPLTDVTVIEEGDDKSFVGYDPAEDRVVVSFRNTQGLGQLIDLINLGLVRPGFSCNGCRVAESFLDAWEEVDSGTLSAIENLADEKGTNDIFLVGHSLGGSMASLCAGFLEDRNPGRFNIIGYTFGTPRTGNARFASWFSSTFPNWFRVVNYNDPVPNIIPSNGGDYVHEPQEIWYFNPPEPGTPPEEYRVLSETNGEDPNGQIQTCDGGNLFRICLNFAHHSTHLNFRDDEDLLC
eukprot:snap_masked-scaffold_10-processed-gene-13.34-mRNA-1 protein AED:1.00 eAED:1.00 QI:0/-1/0/0/-1/1/1/0/307